MNTGNISFSEKKVSKNAVLTLVMGIGILIGFAILTVLSIVTEGRLNVVGGLLGCIFVVLAFFCVLWGVMSYDDAKVDYLSYGEAIDQIKNGQCDVAFVTSGLGNATIKELGTMKKIRFIPIDGKAIENLTKKYPFYMPYSIPKTSYDTEVDTPTAAVMNVMLVDKKLPDDVVYDILTGIYSEKGLATIGASHATAKREIKLDTGLRGIKGTQLILHPGAEKFWKEKGKL